MKVKSLLALWIALFALGSNAAIAAPGNDNFADATTVSGPPSSVSDNTAGATSEIDEPLPCGMAGATVWFQFTAATNVSIVADTLGSDFDTVVGVYRATDSSPTFSDLEEITCNDQAGGSNQSVAAFQAVAGETYFLQIGGWSTGPSIPFVLPPQAETGNLEFHLSEGATISGTVTDSQSNPIAGVCAHIVQSTVEYETVGGAVTNQNGEYAAVVAPGDYKVHFYDCDQFSLGDEWYDDKPNFALADVVTVASGETATGIDAVLGDAPPPPPGPRPDLDITSMTVTSVPIVTDYGSVGYSGYMRQVTVTVQNTGDGDAGWTYVDVFSCPETPLVSSCNHAGGGGVDSIPAGASKIFSFRWNGLGQIGDIGLYATAYTDFDSNYNNNDEHVDSYVILGGIGFGAGIPTP